MLVFILQAQHLLADRTTTTGEPWLLEVTARNLESAILTVQNSSSTPLAITALN